MEEIRDLLILIIELLAYVVLPIILVLVVWFKWRLFEKAGEKGWKAIIPYYERFIMIKIAELNPWLFLIYLLPFIKGIILVFLMIILIIISVILTSTALMGLFITIIINYILTFIVIILTRILDVYILVKLRDIFVKEDGEKMTLWKFVLSFFFLGGILTLFMFGEKKYIYTPKKIKE